MVTKSEYTQRYEVVMPDICIHIYGSTKIRQNRVWPRGGDTVLRVAVWWVEQGEKSLSQAIRPIFCCEMSSGRNAEHIVTDTKNTGSAIRTWRRFADDVSAPSCSALPDSLQHSEEEEEEEPGVEDSVRHWSPSSWRRHHHHQPGAAGPSLS